MTFYEIPLPSREHFPDDETYEKALASTGGRDYGAEGDQVSIEGLDKAELLATFYNSSTRMGMGFLNERGSEDLSIEEARKIIGFNDYMYFDYLHGRVLKIDLGGHTLNTRLFDRDHGRGAGKFLVEQLRAKHASDESSQSTPE